MLRSHDVFRDLNFMFHDKQSSRHCIGIDAVYTYNNNLYAFRVSYISKTLTKIVLSRNTDAVEGRGIIDSSLHLT